MTTVQGGTPPHLPTYNVVLSIEQIRAILSVALPRHRYASSSQLASGKSFNNRIYFIEAEETAAHDGSSIHTVTQDYVLKLSGHYFGASKVRNEVGALQLLRIYCPSVPAPQVLAWSDTGAVIQTINGSVIDTTSNQASSGSAPIKLNQATTKHGWILMTRLIGRPLTFDDLDSPSGGHLMRELASHIATWRTSIPSTGEIGNLRLYDPEVPSTIPPTLYDLSGQTNSLSKPQASTQIQESRSGHLKYTVGGLLLCYRYDPAPLLSTLEYYRYLATDQLLHLKAVPQLAPLRDKIVQQVEKFIDDTLPHLPFLKASEHLPSLQDTGPSKSFNPINKPHDTPDVTATEAPRANTSTFTSFDLSPRNVLVSEVSVLPPSSIPSSQAPSNSGTTIDLPMTSRTSDNTSSDPRLQITGIIDLEFSGIFPAEEEFINLLVRQSSDWPEHHFRTLLQELACLLGNDAHGTPLGITKFEFDDVVGLTRKHDNIEKEKEERKEKAETVAGESQSVGGEDRAKQSAFQGFCVLAKVIECIKPWFIQEGSHSLEEIEKESEKAASVVRRGIHWLVQLTEQQQQQQQQSPSLEDRSQVYRAHNNDTLHCMLVLRERTGKLEVTLTPTCRPHRAHRHCNATAPTHPPTHSVRNLMRSRKAPAERPVAP